MDVRLIILLITPLLCDSKIKIDITASTNEKDVKVHYSGIETKVITEADMNLFKINQNIIRDAVQKYYGRKPSDVFLKSPTPWGDLYKKYNWKEVQTQLIVDKIKIKGIKNNTVIIINNDFNNFSNKTIKVNTGMTQTVENTVSTTWSKDKEVSVTQNFDYDVNVIFAKIAGSTGISYTTTWGKSVEKSESITVGSSTGVEVELSPKQAVTASLQATRGLVQIEIEYKLKLIGLVAINFKRKIKDHHFYSPSIETIMKAGDLKNFVKKTEIIQIGFYTDTSIKVFDKETGLPL